MLRHSFVQCPKIVKHDGIKYLQLAGIIKFHTYRLDGTAPGPDWDALDPVYQRARHSDPRLLSTKGSMT